MNISSCSWRQHFLINRVPRISISKILSIIEESKEKSARMTQLCYSLHHRNRITKAHVKKLTLQRTLRLSILNISVKIPGLSIDVLSLTMSVIATGNMKIYLRNDYSLSVCKSLHAYWYDRKTDGIVDFIIHWNRTAINDVTDIARFYYFFLFHVQYYRITGIQRSSIYSRYELTAR